MASPSASPRLLTVAIALVALAIYAPVIGGGFVWDDHRLIESNGPSLSAPDAWKTAFTSDFWHVAEKSHTGMGDHRLYRPLLKLVLITEYALFGTEHLAGYHLVSLVLHVLCGVLVFRWLRRRAGGESQPELLAAFAGALVFVLHPTRAESVSWISGASDLWTALCVLLALEAWDRSEGAVATAIATLAFVAALLFKESAAAIPVALAADAFWLAPSRAERWRRWKRVAIPFGTLVAVFLGRLLIVPLRDGGALHNVGSRPLRFLASVGQFTRLALWPVPPSTQVGYIPSSAYGGTPAYPGWAVAVGVITIVLLLLLAFAAAFRRPGWRPALADLCWFWIPALPMLNIIPLGGLQYSGERFLYLPGLGLAALTLRAALAVEARPATVRRAATIGFAVLILGAAFVVRVRTRAFADELSLWTAEYARDPTNGMVLESLMTAASKAHRYDIQEKAARESLRLQQDPHARAYMLVQWLRARTDEAKNDQMALLHLRTDADALAAGHLQGELGELAVNVPADGLEWVRTAPQLNLTRAFLWLRSLSFDRAVELAALPTTDSLQHEVAWRITLLARVAQGRWEDAKHTAADPTAPQHVLPLLAQAAQRASAPGAAAYVARAETLYQLGDPSLARGLADSILEVFPQSEDVIRLLIVIDLDLHLFDEARKIVAVHRAPDTEAWAAETLRTIDEAQQDDARLAAIR